MLSKNKGKLFKAVIVHLTFILLRCYIAQKLVPLLHLNKNILLLNFMYA